MSVPTSTTASSPSTLIAEIPGILGFYPENSVIFCTLISTESRSTHRLGPVMRMDCGDTESLAEIAAYTAQASPDMTFVVLVTESPDHAFIQAIAEGNHHPTPTQTPLLKGLLKICSWVEGG